jgi:pyridoxal 5'-phosphate synthase pdxS subunit
MIRSKGEAGTGDVSNAVTHMRKILGEIRRLSSMARDELYVAAKELQAPYDLVVEVADRASLPVVLFTAGGIATPADAAMMMQLGADGVFVGSGIFKAGGESDSPAERAHKASARAKAIVEATLHYDNADVVAKVSRGLGEAMVGINVADLPVHHRLEDRGW